jgi:hypothetical protein
MMSKEKELEIDMKVAMPYIKKIINEMAEGSGTDYGFVIEVFNAKDATDDLKTQYASSLALEQVNNAILMDHIMSLYRAMHNRGKNKQEFIMELMNRIDE